MSPPPTKVVIVGAGRHGKEVAAYLTDLASTDGSVDLIGFIDETVPEGPFAGSRVMGDFDALRDLAAKESGLQYITATGDNQTRRKFVEAVAGAGQIEAFSLVHPASYVGSRVDLGEGTCLAPGTVVTTDVAIGRHSILNVRASVSHDCEIGDFCNINPGAVVCGDVQLGEGCYIGAGAVIRDKATIGEWTVIGAGAVVVSDIPPHSLAVGIPARPVPKPGSTGA